MFAHTEIWQHNVSGEWYLVRVYNEEIIYTNGPLPREDAEYCVNECGGEFDGEYHDNEWFTTESFTVVYK